MHKKLFVLLAVLVLASLTLTACGGGTAKKRAQTCSSRVCRQNQSPWRRCCRSGHGSLQPQLPPATVEQAKATVPLALRSTPDPLIWLRNRPALKMTSSSG